MELSSLTQDGTSEPVLRDQILRRERGQGNTHFPCSRDYEQDWQPYPVDPYSCYMCDHTRPIITGKRRTKIYSTEMYSFLCSKRPRKVYAFTFSDGHKKTGFAELRPFLFYGLSCRVDLHFLIE